MAVLQIIVVFAIIIGLLIFIPLLGLILAIAGILILALYLAKEYIDYAKGV